MIVWTEEPRRELKLRYCVRSIPLPSDDLPFVGKMQVEGALLPEKVPPSSPNKSREQEIFH